MKNEIETIYHGPAIEGLSPQVRAMIEPEKSFFNDGITTRVRAITCSQLGSTHIVVKLQERLAPCGCNEGTCPQGVIHRTVETIARSYTEESDTELRRQRGRWAEQIETLPNYGAYVSHKTGTQAGYVTNRRGYKANPEMERARDLRAYPIHHGRAMQVEVLDERGREIEAFRIDPLVGYD